jgi:outer membrane lipoprotein-sorting protein
MKLNYNLCALLGLLTLFAFAQSCNAQTGSAPTSDLEKLLDPLGKTVDALNSYFVDMTTSMTVVAGAQTQQELTRVQMWRSRPDKYYIRAESKQHDLVLICDGKQLFMYIPKMNQYSLSDVGPEAQALLATAGMGGGTSSYLFMPKMRPQIVQAAKDKSAKELPEELSNGVACRKFMLSSPPNHDLVWIPKTGPLLVARTISHQDFNGQLKLENDTTFRWITDKSIPDSTYTIQPPPGAQKIDAMNLAALMQGTPVKGTSRPGQSAPASTQSAP